MSGEWFQQALMPPEVYEATIKVGVIPSADHVQVWWEVKDPTTGVLIAQGSRPHATMHGLRDAIASALDRAVAALEVRVEPF